MATTPNQSASPSGAASKAASSAATAFSGVADAFVAAMNAGLDAQAQALGAWSKAFGVEGPAVAGGFRARAGAMADLAARSARENAAFAGECMGVSAGFFGKSVESFLGADAPATPEAGLATMQKLGAEAVEITRAAAERGVEIGVKQVESAQSLVQETWSEMTKRTAKAASR